MRNAQLMFPYYGHPGQEMNPLIAGKCKLIKQIITTVRSFKIVISFESEPCFAGAQNDCTSMQHLTDNL